MRRRVALVTRSFAERPAYDTAVSRALLHAVAAGRAPETLRLHRPGEVVAFSALDRARPGFAAAVEAARGAGYGAILRLAGGRAAVFHAETLAFAWCVPDDEPRARIAERFAAMAESCAEALRALGVDARVGEVPGEYCPGEHSVNARGRTKLVGIGQRLVRGAAHVGGVLVVGGSARVRDALVPVYRAMEVPWDPATVGAVEDEVPGTTFEDARQALATAFAKQADLFATDLPQPLLEDAAALTPHHEL